jgi:hypothetical protein
MLIAPVSVHLAIPSLSINILYSFHGTFLTLITAKPAVVYSGA